MSTRDRGSRLKGPETGAPRAPRAAVDGAREVEVKFQADAAGIAAVLASALLEGVAVAPARDLSTTYFDTPGRDLHRNGMTLRLRRKGRAAPVLGVKWDRGTPGDIFGRGEIEIRCPDGQPHVERFEPAVRERLLAAIAGQELAPVFETRIRRRVAMLRQPDAEIEMSIDEGDVVAGEAGRPLCEIELELKRGQLSGLIACAAELGRSAGLSLAFEPKAGRGYRLRDASPPQPAKALPLDLPEQASFDDVVAAVLSNTLAHFVANWAALRDSDAPESVHQLRVALRRMRSALGAFGRASGHPQLAVLRAEARRIASALGPARECDAFRQNVLGGPLRNQPHQLKGALRLLDAVDQQRQHAYAGARRLIDDPATSLFVLDVQAFIAGRAWQAAPDKDGTAAPAPSGRAFAAATLDRLHRRALKRGKHLPDMPDEARHELRIALKNLRYAAEFFGSLFARRKEVRAFIAHVTGLQEHLGAHNDAVTARAFIEGLALPPGDDAAFAAGYVLGWYRHATEAADASLRRQWKDFRRAEAFWT